MKAVMWMAIAFVGACSSPSSTETLGGPENDSVHVEGSLRLELRDSLSPGGILWALPSVTGQTGSVMVENTRYGSLCRFAVTGRADVQPGRIGLHIAYSERLTSCTAEIRKLQYVATITAPAGPYEVAVIHEENNRADTLVKRAVTVR
jgi:hypothetical protein